MAASPPERDPNETQEWLDALDDVLRERGPQAAHALLEDLITRARGKGAFIPFSPNTPYVNTIPTALEAQSPGDHAVEWRIRSLTRWNATAMVVNANREHAGIGGHIASFASSASTISGRARTTKTALIWSTFRATSRRAFMRAPTLRGASARRSCSASAWRRWRPACRAIRTRG